MLNIKIIYRDGTEESVYVDDYCIGKNCLSMYTRAGENKGTRYIPLDLIKEWGVI